MQVSIRVSVQEDGFKNKIIKNYNKTWTNQLRERTINNPNNFFFYEIVNIYEI